MRRISSCKLNLPIQWVYEVLDFDFDFLFESNTISLLDSMQRRKSKATIDMKRKAYEFILVVVP
jgi:hypothetical protein